MPRRKSFPQDHLEMRGTQFFAASANPDHPCHHLQEPTPTLRHIHITPTSVYESLRAKILPYPSFLV